MCGAPYLSGQEEQPSSDQPGDKPPARPTIPGASRAHSGQGKSSDESQSTGNGSQKHSAARNNTQQVRRSVPSSPRRGTVWAPIPTLAETAPQRLDDRLSPGRAILSTNKRQMGPQTGRTSCAGPPTCLGRRSSRHPISRATPQTARRPFNARSCDSIHGHRDDKRVLKQVEQVARGPLSVLVEGAAVIRSAGRQPSATDLSGASRGGILR